MDGGREGGRRRRGEEEEGWREEREGRRKGKEGECEGRKEEEGRREGGREREVKTISCSYVHITHNTLIMVIKYNINNVINTSFCVLLIMF